MREPQPNPLNPPDKGDFPLNSPLIRGARGVKNDERWVFAQSLSIESTRIFNDVESHQIILHGESLRYSATSAVTVDSSPSGLMASVHAAITKSLSNRIEFKQKELTVAQIAYDNLDNQKTSRGVEWRGGEQLAKLKEASANLKKAMAKKLNRNCGKRNRMRQTRTPLKWSINNWSLSGCISIASMVTFAIETVQKTNIRRSCESRNPVKQPNP